MHGGEILETLYEALKTSDCFMISIKKEKTTVHEFRQSTGRMVFSDEFVIQSSFENELADMRLFEIF